MLSNLDEAGTLDTWLYTLIAFVFYFSKVPAFLNVVDIAGLVKGASEGQGLGNAFLSHIRACDALFHLCRKLILKTQISAKDVLIGLG